MKSTKGITLIALVITIIVLLILAGITINLTLGEHGILNMAKEAGKNYQNAAEYEQQAIGDFFNEAQNIIAGGNGNGTTTTPEVPAINVSDLKPGNYINYDSGTNGIIICRVLYPAESEYGLQIIANAPVGGKKVIPTDVNGWETVKPGYNSIIQQLNTETEKYINNEFVSDSRCVGSLPFIEGDRFFRKNDGAEETVQLLEDIPTPSGWSSRDTGCLSGDNNSEVDIAQLKRYELLDCGIDYTLASRKVKERNGMMCFGIEFSERRLCSETLLNC